MIIGKNGSAPGVPRYQRRILNRGLATAYLVGGSVMVDLDSMPWPRYGKPKRAAS